MGRQTYDCPDIPITGRVYGIAEPLVDQLHCSRFVFDCQHRLSLAMSTSNHVYGKAHDEVERIWIERSHFGIQPADSLKSVVIISVSIKEAEIWASVFGHYGDRKALFHLQEKD